MKHKTSELSGARLDQAVAKARGYLYDKNISEDFIITALDQSIPQRAPEHVHREVCRVVIDGQDRSFCPSSEWAHGGPIIERERIGTSWDYRSEPTAAWEAEFEHDQFEEGGATRSWGYGETLLVAAMRAFVTAKLGAEVDL